MNGFEIWRDEKGRLWARPHVVHRRARERRDVAEHRNAFDDDEPAAPLRLVKPDPPAKRGHEEDGPA